MIRIPEGAGLNRTKPGLLLILASFSVLSSGCLVACEKDIAGEHGEFASFEPKALGDWINTDEKPDRYKKHDPDLLESFLRVERETPTSNTLILREMDVRRSRNGPVTEEVPGKENNAKVRIVRIGDRDYCSFVPEERSEHSFFLWLVWGEDAVTLNSMDPEYFKKHPDVTPFRKEEYDTIALTGSVSELHSFLKSHADDEGLWLEKDLVLHLKKREAK
jgi:hypothetical protein